MSDSFEDIMAGVLDDTPDILVDQDMQKAIDRAKEINEILRTAECSVDQMHAYIAEVDSLWQEWYGQALAMNGTAYFDLDKDEPRSVELRGHTVYSDGFAILVHGLPGGEGSPQIVHSIKVHPFDVLPEGDPKLEAFLLLDPEEVPLLNTVAPLEAMFDPGCFTAERALQYVELFHPELVAEIDRRIVHTNSSVEALLALRDLSFNLYIELDSEMANAALCAYLTSLISIDDRMPHQLTLGKGEIYLKTEAEDGKQLTVRVNGESFYGMVHNVIHFAALGDEQDRSYTLAVDVSPVLADHREVERSFCVPVNAIASLEATRGRLH